MGAGPPHPTHCGCVPLSASRVPLRACHPPLRWSCASWWFGVFFFFYLQVNFGCCWARGRVFPPSAPPPPGPGLRRCKQPSHDGGCPGAARAVPGGWPSPPHRLRPMDFNKEINPPGWALWRWDAAVPGGAGGGSRFGDTRGCRGGCPAWAGWQWGCAGSLAYVDTHARVPSHRRDRTRTDTSAHGRARTWTRAHPTRGRGRAAEGAWPAPSLPPIQI